MHSRATARLAICSGFGARRVRISYLAVVNRGSSHEENLSIKKPTIVVTKATPYGLDTSTVLKGVFDRTFNPLLMTNVASRPISIPKKTSKILTLENI
jgi:hypothetical protein